MEHLIGNRIGPHETWQEYADASCLCDQWLCDEIDKQEEKKDP